MSQRQIDGDSTDSTQDTAAKDGPDPPTPPDDEATGAFERWLDPEGEDGIRPITALAITLIGMAPLSKAFGIGTAFGILGGILTLYQFFYRAAKGEL